MTSFKRIYIVNIDDHVAGQDGNASEDENTLSEYNYGKGKDNESLSIDIDSSVLRMDVKSKFSVSLNYSALSSQTIGKNGRNQTMFIYSL